MRILDGVIYTMCIDKILRILK